jgi:DNA-binding transcriptional LysR family regulator
VKDIVSLKGIASFVAVAAQGSFSAAAKTLGVSAVAVSKNVAALEQQLTVRLFQRTTRTLSLTREGETYFRQCSAPLRALQAAQASVQSSNKSPSGLVRISCAAPFAQGFVMPLVPEFLSSHPKVQIELHLIDSVSDLVTENYDVGIRVGPLRESTMVARPIANLPFVICASPNYLDQHGTPATLEQLMSHNCLRLRRPGRGNAMPWFLHGINDALQARLCGNFLVNDFAALLSAAIQHQGIVCVPLPMAMPLFRSGQLKPLLPALVEAKLVAYLYYPNRRNLPSRTRSFVEFLLGKLAREKDLQTAPEVLLAPFC